MDFTLSEDQIAARDLAAKLFTDLATTDRVKAVEATPDRIDRELWRALADAGLLALVLPEAHGGSEDDRREDKRPVHRGRQRLHQPDAVRRPEGFFRVSPR